MKLTYRPMFLVLLLPLLFARTDSKSIKLCFIGAMTGHVADPGIAGRNGVILATEEVNQGGGINNRRIELLIRDDQQDPLTLTVKAPFSKPQIIPRNKTILYF